MKIKELMEKRAVLVKQMRDMNDKAEEEKRGFTAEDDEKWAKMTADIEALDAKIDREKKLSTEEQRMAADATEQRAHLQPEQNGGSDQPTGTFDEMATFRSWLSGGMGSLSAEQRDYMAARQANSRELRAFSSGTSNTGGYTVPEEFYNQLEVAMQAYGPMLEDGVADILRTDTGATLPMPTFNYTGVSASIVGENTQISSDSSTPFGVVNLDAYMYAPPVLPVSIQFLDDSAFGEGFIANAQGEALGRGINAHLTTGTGSAQPNGIVTASTLGKTGATGQTTSVTVDDLIDLIHSIDPAYRRDSRFMMNDNSLKVIKKLKDSQNRPLWLPGYTTADPDTVNGFRYVINQDMADMAANAKSILFGRLDKYKVRLVRSAQMMRLTERYADYLQVGFITFLRADGDLLDAGTNPVKYYANSAT